MKKRVLSLCLAGLMAASLAGCGGAGNTAETTTAAGTETSAAASENGSSEAKEELVFVNYRDIRAFYGAQRSPFCFRTAAFRSQRPPIF